MIPEEALHVHYVGNDRGTIDEFEIDESFWVEQNPFTMLRAPAKLKKIGERDPATFRQLTDEDLDRFVAEGMAIEHEPVHYEQFNDPDTAFCHRCGTTDGVEGHVNRWSGNITLLCPNCEAAQARMAGVIGDIDPAVLEALDRDGFVVVDLFDDAARAEARTIIDTLGIATDNPFYVMNRDASRDDAVRVDQALQQLVQPSIDRALNGYRVFKSIPIVKGNVGDNPVNLHQDWEYVDERYHRGYGVWCPLDGASEAQGGIFVVPGSHKWMDNHRGSGFEDPYRNVLDLIIERGSVFVPLAPGQAVVYDNQLLHHTSPNTSDAPRVVVASVICPPDAAVIHMHSTDGGATAEVFEIPAGDTYFTAKEFGSRPDGIPTRTVDVAVPTVTEADVLAWIPEPIVREVTAVTAANGHVDHEKIAPPPATADGSGTTEPILLDRPVSALPLKSGLGERVKQLLGR
ncbi:MAG: phytanoyl-CoA dioxygenase family protein [Actinomycetes bacterium]